MQPPSERQDRLYELLPAIHRMRDADHGYPLQALLRVIAEQVNVVEDDITQLYENWFIETAQDWVTTYIGDLIGYRPVHEAGEPGAVSTPQGQQRNKILIPRREVANTIRYRRRKGALALLETLANDVAGWPARVVEFYKLLGWAQNVNHLQLGRAHTLNLRNGDALDLLDGPFDPQAHTVDVRQIHSRQTVGRYNIPSVGLFVWRLKVYSITKAPAYCLEEVGPHCYTFSILSNDTPLYSKPEPEPTPTHIADEVNLPTPIRRRSFEQRPERYYGPGKSIAIWVGDWARLDPDKPVPVDRLIAADLSNWQYRPPRNFVAVDPVRGRLAFPPSQLPKRVAVSYHYAFSADLGGGEYERPLAQPVDHRLYRVGEAQPFRSIHQAWSKWQADLQEWPTDEPQNAVIEITDSAVYVEQINLSIGAKQSVQLRAANRARPVIRLLDWHTDLPDALTVTVEPGARFTLDGLLITGRAVHIRQKEEDEGKDATAGPLALVTIRHCTLTPGWGIQNDCEPRRPAEPSLELFNARARLCIEQSIVGSIQINEDEVNTDPIPVQITDSILDATRSEREALGAPGCPVAHAVLTIRRCTVFGIVNVHAIELAENSIFTDCLNVARRQLGCMRFCYVPHGCRTPRRYHCQPDLAEEAAVEALHQIVAAPTQSEIDVARGRARLRVHPHYNSVRYGAPTYCQLAASCPVEITQGADDEAELGVFHNLYQPQRAANLRARLDEYMPAGMQAGIIFAS
jgi:hypothetical protein